MPGLLDGDYDLSSLSEKTRKSNGLQILVFAVSFFASVNYLLVLSTFGYKK